MPDIVPLPADYATWLAELKTRIHTTQRCKAIGQQPAAQLPRLYLCALIDKLKAHLSKCNGQATTRLTERRVVTCKIDVRNFQIHGDARCYQMTRGKNKWP